MLKHSSRYLPVLVLLTLVVSVLPGGGVETRMTTEVNEDGSLIRALSMKMEQADRDKEAVTYPVKTYTLPTGTGWTLAENTKTTLKVQARIQPGQPIPGGYDRLVKVLNRRSANEVRLEVRDHFLAKSYRYEERFSDTIRPEEFKQSLLEEYDRFAKRMLDSVRADFSEGYDTAVITKYLTKDFRKLIEDSADTAIENGIWEAAGVVAVRLALGGFPLKNANQLMNAEPHVVLEEMLRHFMRKLRVTSESPVETESFEKLKKSLLAGAPDEQGEARRILVELGPKVLRQLENAYHDEQQTDEAETIKAKAAGKPAVTRPETLRLESVIQAIRDKIKDLSEVFVLKFSKELEETYLRPAADKREAIERTIAQILGAHIEGNFASIDYLFGVRVKLPGELAVMDSQAKRLNDGSVEWSFSALDFYLKPIFCQARSRLWNNARITVLSEALTGDGKTLTLKRCGEIEDALAKLETPSAERVAAALESCSNTKNREPLTTLSLDDKAPPGAAACAKFILEKVPAAKP